MGSRVGGNAMTRNDGRSPGALRPIKIARGAARQAEGSALVEMGRTKVLCAATVEERVPPSASSTSQSSRIVRSPKAERSVTARSERPIKREISSARPPFT